MNRMLIGLLMLCACASGHPQGGTISGPSQVPLYGKAVFRLAVETAPAQPYCQEEACVDLELQAPSGRTLVLPAFWDGAAWEARFTPQEEGRYTCRFVSPEGRLSAGRQFEVTPSEAHGILHTDGLWVLRYDDGTPFRGVGENLCWESRAHDDSKFFRALHERHDRFSYSVMLPQFAAAGGNFTRMWMCSWNFPIDRKADFNNPRYTPSEDFYNPSAVAHLDQVVDLADSLGLKIMLCMGQGDVEADRAFFTDPQAKARYRDRLRYIVARWGYSPAIGMWEFFNEIDNIQFNNKPEPIPAAEIVAWHAEMAAYLKSIDPFGHIVTTSISHRDLEGLNDVPDIDVNQKHIYKATSAIPSTLVSYTERHGKPYVIGEFGYEWDWSKNFDDFAEDMDRDFKRGLWYGLFSPTPVTPMSWWWEYFENRGLVPYFRNVRFVSEEMLQHGKGSFEPVPVQCPADAYAVKCGDRIYLYIFNNTRKPIRRLPLRGGSVRELDFAEACWRPLPAALSIAPGQEALFELQQPNN